MDNQRKIVVTMTSWTKRIGNCCQVIQSILDNTTKPDLVYLNLSLEEFPNRYYDLPSDLVSLSRKNPQVKINWVDGKNTKCKYLTDSDTIIDVDNECSIQNDFIETRLKQTWRNGTQDSDGLDMTMISVFYDNGVNELRKVATRKAVSHWIQQKHLPKEMLFLELGFNGVFTFSQADFPSQIKYIKIDGTDENKYLFQKEHLWNIAAKMAKYEKLMFVDSDIAPIEDVDWFFEIYNILDTCIFAQGFNKVFYLDKNDNRNGMVKQSFSNGVLLKENISSTTNVPGGVYCITKNTLEKIGYFNYLPFGGGDNLFWWEIYRISNKFNWLFTLFGRSGVLKIIIELAQNGDKDVLHYVKSNVCHFYHGEKKGRSYGQRQYMMITQFPLIDRIITESDNQLVSWISLDHYFYSIMSKLHIVNDNKIVANEFLKDYIDYIGFYDEIIKKKFKTSRQSILSDLLHLQTKYIKK